MCGSQAAFITSVQTSHCNWLDAPPPTTATLSAALAPLRRPEAYTTSVDHSKLVCVREYGDRPDAELALATLFEAGINAMIQSDSVGGMRDHLAWSGAGFKVLVLDQDSDAAKEILDPTASNANLDE